MKNARCTYIYSSTEPKQGLQLSVRVLFFLFAKKKKQYPPQQLVQGLAYLQAAPSTIPLDSEGWKKEHRSPHLPPPLRPWNTAALRASATWLFQGSAVRYLTKQVPVPPPPCLHPLTSCLESYLITFQLLLPLFLKIA